MGFLSWLTGPDDDDGFEAWANEPMTEAECYGRARSYLGRTGSLEGDYQNDRVSRRFAQTAVENGATRRSMDWRNI
jgi:hypothetical protein